MLIYLLLYGVGLVLSFICLWRLIRGIRHRDVRQCIIVVLIPVLFWLAIATLHYLDHRMVENYRREHGGELPPWLW